MIPARSFTSTELDPYRRGLEFGRAHAERVQATIAFYRGLLARCPRDDVRLAQWGPRVFDLIDAAAPELAAELTGLAKGAGVALSELAAVNARTELLALADPEGALECTAVVRREQGIHRGAQTWDWYGGMAGNWLAWTVPHEHGWFTTVTEFGILGKIGVNSHGLGLLLNILNHVTDGTGATGDDRVGFPVHLIARFVLQHASSVEQAIRLVLGARTSASSALTLFDAHSVVTAELFPAGPGRYVVEAGPHVHTNHFLGEAGASGCRYAGEGSHRRLAGVAARAADPGTTLLAALVDHDPRGPVCRHGSTPEAEATLATVDIELDPPRLRAWQGGPCSVVKPAVS